MKKLLLILMLLPNVAFANLNCGIPPIPPIGCQMICICDSSGFQCTYVPVCG